MTHEKLHIDRKLKINIFAACVIIAICPVALWLLYFRGTHNISDQEKFHVKLTEWCMMYNKPEFHSEKLVAETVTRFYDTTNVSSVDMDYLIALKRQEEMYPRAKLLPDSVYISDREGGSKIVSAWIQEVSYLKPQLKFRQVDLHYQFVYDKEGRISSVEILDERYEKFSSSMPKP